MSTTLNNRGFCWYELMTTDPKAAQAFYTEVIGWKTQSFDAGMEYTMWVGPNGPLGGVMTLPEQARQMGAPSHWMGYVAVDDLKAATERAAQLGAKILVPITEIPNAGSFSVFMDPAGAVCALHWSKEQGPARDPATSKQGEVCWHEYLHTTGTGLDFYQQLFGWQKTDAMDMGGMGTYQMFNRGEGSGTIGGSMKAPPGVPSHWMYYFQTDDLKAAVERVKRLGGKILNGPMDVPGGEIVNCMDPQGAAFSLHATKA